MSLSQLGENSDSSISSSEYMLFYKNELSSEIDSIKSVYNTLINADSALDKAESIENIIKLWNRTRSKIYAHLDSVMDDDVSGYILEKLLRLRLHKLGNQINLLNACLYLPNVAMPVIDWDELKIPDSDILNPKGGSLKEVLKNVCPKYKAELSIHQSEESDIHISNFHPLIFGEIIKELIMNAHHADAAHVTVTLDETSDSYVVSVKDNGKGINKGHLKDIFTDGYTTRAEGTGTGLYLTSKYITEFMGGDISAESVCADGIHDDSGSVHSGTVIRMTLPKENAHL